MSNDTTYNGWANWQTWNTALWFQNDEGLYRSILRDARKVSDWDTNKIHAEDAEEIIMSHFDGGVTPDGADVTNCDWDEIAGCINECLAGESA
jgi:hypothetical protein